MEKIILLELSKRCGVNGKDYFIGNNQIFKEDTRDIKEENSLLTLGYMLWLAQQSK